jgi:cytochrome c biogenesis protein
VNPERLTPFEVAVDRLDVTFEERAGGAQFGAPRDFTAFTTTRQGLGAPAEKQVLKVNRPLSLGGASVFLLGNGYAPVITVRDAKGQVLYNEATPFLPQDNNYRSVGAVKVSGASPKQLGFAGLFLPSAVIDRNLGPTSYFPDLKAPALALTAWEGDLYPGGRPQSVYSLGTQSMTQLKAANGQPLRIWLTPGATVQLPGGRGSISMGPVPRFAGLSVRHDPGKMLALWGSLAALAGLIASLVIRRRRVFIRVAPAAPAEPLGADDREAQPATVVTIGGLAKGHDTALAAYIAGLLATITERTGRSS